MPRYQLNRFVLMADLLTRFIKRNHIYHTSTNAPEERAVLNSSCRRMKSRAQVVSYDVTHSKIQTRRSDGLAETRVLIKILILKGHHLFAKPFR